MKAPEIVWQAVIVLFSVITILRSIFVINQMTRKTNHFIRAAYVFMAAGVFGECVGIFSGHVPGLDESLIVIGLGLLNAADRRSATRCPILNINVEGHRHDDECPAASENLPTKPGHG